MIALIVASILLQEPAAIQREDFVADKKQIAAAAIACGTRIRFTNLPEAMATAAPGRFGFSLAANATPTQRTCFYRRVPSEKVGFISEPPPANTKRLAHQ